ncbi:MAG: hypothetical protein QNJ97_07370 [Myxococcota bacterium]|nr:hypothetical protein [Myxococcota bacterium]
MGRRCFFVMLSWVVAMGISACHNESTLERRLPQGSPAEVDSAASSTESAQSTKHNASRPEGASEASSPRGESPREYYCENGRPDGFCNQDTEFKGLCPDCLACDCVSMMCAECRVTPNEPMHRALCRPAEDGGPDFDYAPCGLCGFKVRKCVEFSPGCCSNPDCRVLHHNSCGSWSEWSLDAGHRCFHEAACKIDTSSGQEIPQTRPCGEKCGHNECLASLWMTENHNDEYLDPDTPFGCYWSECQDEKECSPNDEPQTQTCGNCGTQYKHCSDQCQWDAEWGACEGEGSCPPGQVQTQIDNCPSGSQKRECQADCTWGPWGACEDEGCPAGVVKREGCRGNTGIRTSTCIDGQWSDWGDCLFSREGDGKCDGLETCATSEDCNGSACDVSFDACEAAPGELPERADCFPGGWNDHKWIPADRDYRPCGQCGFEVRKCLPWPAGEEWEGCWSRFSECRHEFGCDYAATRSCESGCQTQTCVASDWLGQQEITPTGCYWAECEGCTDGEVQTEHCQLANGSTGTWHRTCDNCNWGPWGNDGVDGKCKGCSDGECSADENCAICPEDCQADCEQLDDIPDRVDGAQCPILEGQAMGYTCDYQSDPPEYDFRYCGNCGYQVRQCLKVETGEATVGCWSQWSHQCRNESECDTLNPANCGQCGKVICNATATIGQSHTPHACKLVLDPQTSEPLCRSTPAPPFACDGSPYDPIWDEPTGCAPLGPAGESCQTGNCSTCLNHTELSCSHRAVRACEPGPAGDWCWGQWECDQQPPPVCDEATGRERANCCLAAAQEAGENLNWAINCCAGLADAPDDKSEYWQCVYNVHTAAQFPGCEETVTGKTNFPARRGDILLFNPHDSGQGAITGPLNIIQGVYLHQRGYRPGIWGFSHGQICKKSVGASCVEICEMDNNAGTLSNWLGDAIITEYDQDALSLLWAVQPILGRHLMCNNLHAIHPLALSEAKTPGSGCWENYSHPKGGLTLRHSGLIKSADDPLISAEARRLVEIAESPAFHTRNLSGRGFDISTQYLYAEHANRNNCCNWLWDLAGYHNLEPVHFPKAFFVDMFSKILGEPTTRWNQLNASKNRLWAAAYKKSRIKCDIESGGVGCICSKDEIWRQVRAIVNQVVAWLTQRKEIMFEVAADDPGFVEWQKYIPAEGVLDRPALCDDWVMATGGDGHWKPHAKHIWTNGTVCADRRLMIYARGHGYGMGAALAKARASGAITHDQLMEAFHFEQALKTPRSQGYHTSWIPHCQGYQCFAWAVTEEDLMAEKGQTGSNGHPYAEFSIPWSDDFTAEVETSCGYDGCQPDRGEDCFSCPEDCHCGAVCGSGGCESHLGETKESCPKDCLGCYPPDSVQKGDCGANGTKTRTCECTIDDCAWGDWSDCDEPSCIEGNTEELPCGDCGDGIQTRQCVDGKWGPWSDCSVTPYCGDGCCSGEETYLNCDDCPMVVDAFVGHRENWRHTATYEMYEDTTEQRLPSGCRLETGVECGACLRQDDLIWAYYTGPCGDTYYNPAGKVSHGCSETWACGWDHIKCCIREPCVSSGSIEERPCGMCGLQSRTCGPNRFWGEWSACRGEGACSAGEIEHLPCGKCGSKQRTCNAVCEWGDWSSCRESSADGDGCCGVGETYKNSGDCPMVVNAFVGHRNNWRYTSTFHLYRNTPEQKIPSGCQLEEGEECGACLREGDEIWAYYTGPCGDTNYNYGGKVTTGCSEAWSCGWHHIKCCIE